MSEEVFPISPGFDEREAIRMARQEGATTLVIGLPWGMIAPHEAQAKRNHGGQSLKRLAERGGLSPCEAVAVLKDEPYRRMAPVAAQFRLSLLMAQHAVKAAQDESARDGECFLCGKGIADRVPTPCIGPGCAWQDHEPA